MTNNNRLLVMLWGGGSGGAVVESSRGSDLNVALPYPFKNFVLEENIVTLRFCGMAVGKAAMSKAVESLEGIKICIDVIVVSPNLINFAMLISAAALS